MRVSIEQDVEPWFEAVCALWDDAALYESIGARARQIAEARYAERVSRAQHLDCFTSLQCRFGANSHDGEFWRPSRSSDEGRRLRVYMIVPIRQDRYRARGCAWVHREKETNAGVPSSTGSTHTSI
jgi:hypothetical protein